MNESDYRLDLSMSTLEIPAAFLHSTKRRTGNWSFRCNGIEFEDSKTISRWGWALCRPNLAPSYTGGSTCNMNRHLDTTHGINKDYPIGAGTMPAADGTLHVAFANKIHKLQCNRDLFHAVLLK